MSDKLSYLENELNNLRNEFNEEQKRINEKIESEVQEFSRKFSLDTLDTGKSAALIREYRELKSRLYRRELENKEEKLIALSNKIKELKRIFSVE